MHLQAILCFSLTSLFVYDNPRLPSTVILVYVIAVSAFLYSGFYM